MGNRAHPDAELSQTELEELTAGLTCRRREFVDALATLNQQIAAKDDCSISDAADAASLQEDRVRASGIADQNRRTIAEIDAALSRLQNGQYGVSTVSGEPISFNRLLLVPWARTGADE